MPRPRPRPRPRRPRRIPYSPGIIRPHPGIHRRENLPGKIKPVVDDPRTRPYRPHGIYPGFHVPKDRELIELPVEIKPVEDRIVETSQKEKHAAKTKHTVLECPSVAEEKHPIEFLAQGQPPKSRRKEDGTFYVSNSDQLVCNGCNESFSIS